MTADQPDGAIRLRPYRGADAAALTDIFVRAATITGARAYTPAQVAAWARGASPRWTRRRCADGRLVLVAADGADRAVAFADLEASGHIDMLFCDPSWSGRGIGSALCAAIEDEASRRGMARLHVEASALALPVFERRGFTLLGRNDFTMYGVPTYNFLMEKRLPAALVEPLAGR